MVTKSNDELTTKTEGGENMTNDFEIYAHGDSGILVEFNDNEKAWENAHSLANLLQKQTIYGLLGVIPTYTSVFIQFDVFLTDPTTIKQKVEMLLFNHQTQENSQVVRHYRVPVLYDGEDIESVSNQLDIPYESVFSLHCSKPYKINCLGAPIGQPMMNNVPFPKPVSRLSIPRTLVPEGSVAVAGIQTLIYTANIPGGWKVIGRTPIKMVSVNEKNPVAYRPGDYIEFFPIEEFEWETYLGLSVEKMMVI